MIIRGDTTPTCLAQQCMIMRVVLANKSQTNRDTSEKLTRPQDDGDLTEQHHNELGQFTRGQLP